MWKIITANESTWLPLKEHFQEAYLDREELEKISGAAGYGSAHNVKHGEMEDSIIHFASNMEACDAAFTGLTTKK